MKSLEHGITRSSYDVKRNNFLIATIEKLHVIHEIEHRTHLYE